MTYMMTIPRTVHKRILKIMIEKNDCKRWQIGREKGRDGYLHWQIRLETSNDGFFNWCKVHIPIAHIEESQTWSNYERKEGDYWASDDTPEIRSVRFGTLSKWQKYVLRRLDRQTVRQVDVWYDPEGNHGKSWLCNYCYEHGTGLSVPISVCTPSTIIPFIKTAHNGQKYIFIDIPRSAKIPPSLYEVIESIKDGLLYDPRYHAEFKNIRGCRVAVFTNKKLDTKQLSYDRWVLHGMTIEGEESLS